MIIQTSCISVRFRLYAVMGFHWNAYIYWDASMDYAINYGLEGFTCCFLVNHLNVRWIMLCIGSAQRCNVALCKKTILKVSNVSDKLYMDSKLFALASVFSLSFGKEPDLLSSQRFKFKAAERTGELQMLLPVN